VAFNPERHTYTYDPRGNRTSRTTPYTSSSYSWDQANRLVSVDASTTYSYDADGLRVGSSAGSDARHSTWSRAPGLPLLLTETPASASGTLIADQAVAYIYGPGGRVLTRIDPRPEISVVGTGTDASVAGDTTTVALPAGIRADDPIVLAVTHGHSNSTTATTPAGYSDVATRTSSSATTRVWRRTATGGETSVTVKFNSLVTPKAAVAIVYRGVDPNNPIVATDGASADTTTQITVPSLTSATDGDRLAAFGGAIHLLPGTTTWTAPTGMTMRAQTGANSIAAAATDQPLTAVAPTGTRTLTYATNGTLNGVGVILRRVAPPERWHHADQLGSTRLITDEAGDIVGTATYDAYGNPLATTGETSRLGFAGEYTDPATGLVYLRARWYDPTTAQFLSRDPLEALTQSAYGYAGNDPINYTDPTGLAPWDGVVDWVDDISGQDVANFAGGVLNTITLGNGDTVAGWFGVECNYDKTSGWYFAGEVAAVAIPTGLGGATIARKAGVTAYRSEHVIAGIQTSRKGIALHRADKVRDMHWVTYKIQQGGKNVGRHRNTGHYSWWGRRL
jgi:RHS repeat-associated protein